MIRRGILTMMGLAWLAAAMPAAAIDRDDQLVREADQALFLALSKGDAKGFERQLDKHFTWTDAAGNTRPTKDLLRALPQPGAQVGANLKLSLYGQVAVVTSELDKTHVLRVWVKGRKTWHALAYHEVTVTEPPGGAAPPAAGACENPCRTLPYKPRNASERGALDSWQALETAVTAGDGATWAKHVADEFRVVGNYRVQDKQARIAAVNRAGTVPPPLVSTELYDYGDAIVMTALHQPHAGKPIHVTRIWIKRAGAWQMAISYQTIVQAAPAKTS